MARRRQGRARPAPPPSRPPPTGAIVARPREAPSPALLAAEARLAALLHEVDALDQEVEALAAALAAFEARYRAATAEAYRALEAVERLARRIERLGAELARLRAEVAEGPPRRAARAASPAQAARTARPRAASAPPPAAPPDEVESLEVGALDLKALYRRLARVLHPDLARDAGEQARLSDLMAVANDAYARGDRAALELLAERVGAGDGAAGLSEEERLAHLERRAAGVEEALLRLRGERERLAGSEVARLCDEAAAREAAGGDLLAEAAAAARERAEEVAAEALEELERLGAAAGALERALRAAPGRRGWDPVGASAVLRRAPRRGDRAAPAARALAGWLAGAAEAAPWEAALTLLAFLAEEAGRPPAALASGPALAERWEALRVAWPGAPGLAPALAAAPRHLEIGVRRRGEVVAAGLQLAAPGLLAGVRAALGRPAVAALARAVLSALGPRERCGRCGREGYAVHLLRVRGLDELHGLVCPTCGHALRSFLRYGPPEGLEALAGVALRVGLVAEQRARLGSDALAFQLLPSERAALTAGALVERFRETCLSPHGLALAEDELVVRAGGAALAPGDAVPPRGTVVLATAPGAGFSAVRLAAELRERVRRRFRAPP